MTLLERCSRLATYRPRNHGVVCFLLGILFTLGFAPLFWWPLSLLAIAGLFYYIKQASGWKQAALAGLLFGLGHHITGFYWIVRAFYIALDSWVLASLAGGAALLALAFYLSLYTALVAGVSRLFGRPNPLVFAGLWVLAEVLRSIIFYGFPWNLSGYVWAGHVPMMQLAAFGDIWLLSFLVILCGALMQSRKILAVLCVISIWAFGSTRLYMHQDVEKVGVSVNVLQANVSEAHNWNIVKRWNQLTQHLQLTQAGKNLSGDLVIWPETAVPFFVTDDANMRAEIAKTLRPEQLLITGVPRKTEDENGRHYYNSIIVLDALGHVTSIYDKHKLVPFGEFVPLRGLMPPFIDKFVQNYEDFTPGQKPVNIEIKEGINALPLVCYEAIFPFFVKNNLKTQKFILNLTNDAWFDGTSSPHQHYAMARIRAVANKRPLVRVANTGVTAVLDAYGREIRRLKTKEALFENISF